MNNTQRVLLVIYILLTGLILFLDRTYPKEDIIIYLKYTIIVTLFLSSIIVEKQYKEQKIMALSFFFVVIADFFLVLCDTFVYTTKVIEPLGAMGFLFAYLCLISVYRKKLKITKLEIIVAIPLIIVFVYSVILLSPYISGLMFIGALIFGIVLCLMTWLSIVTIFNRYYSTKASLLIGFSGILMFICDMAVALSRFHPLFSGDYRMSIANVIWTSYIPGWTLLAVVINEKKLLNIKKKT
ncbi:lysoplasmalogenase family protein [Clostridium cellulovorans]|uniref:YhhN family protein n=1 Tax=Clostridium cellulovorans (strain ATCC 35296 / DSM 3052 / OCM 3 / 743B) TaxID=573061 RepID=D9SQP8_CLOC7|nr:lysoplasmalogenase family protein [Clostridium cellulovorans]ADL52254.1 YhhN family protein [Clostridium cellulovorans 743B]